MKKAVIEVTRLPDHPYNYGCSDYGYTNESILNLIVDFTQGKNVTIYKHLVKHRFESYNDPLRILNDSKHQEVNDMKIPLGDLIIELTIYYQEKQ